MKKSTLTENKAEQTPTGGVLVGKRKGQTIIHNKGTLSGYLVGKTHAEGGIKAVNKSTGQPLEMQGGEVVITAPAVSDQTKNEFNGKMMTNREILSQINVNGGGVAFAKGGDIPKRIKRTGASYKYGGKTMTDHEIYKYITGGGIAEEFSIRDIADIHQIPLDELKQEVRIGMLVESEHKGDKKEQMEIVKDHLFENPKYYTLLKQAGLVEEKKSLKDKSKWLQTFYVTNNPSIDKFLKDLQPKIEELIEKQKELVIKETTIVFGMPKPMTETDIQFYEVGLIFKMVQAFNKYLKNTDELYDVSINKRADLFEVNSKVKRDGRTYKFDTELIGAGGYNIQEYHYRYIIKTDLPYSNENSAVENIKAKIGVVKKIRTIDEDIARYLNNIKRLEQENIDGFVNWNNEIINLSTEHIDRNKRSIIDYGKEIEKLEGKKADLISVFESLDKKGVGVNFGKQVKEAIGSRILVDRLRGSKYKETGDTLDFKIESRIIKGKDLPDRRIEILGTINTFSFVDEGNGLCTMKAGLELRGKYTPYAEYKNLPIKEIPYKINEIFNGEFQKYLQYEDGGAFENGGEVESLYENENDYVKYLVKRSLTIAVEEYKLKQYLKSKGLGSVGLLPDDVKKDPEYIKLKRDFDIAFKKLQNTPIYKYPKNRDRVQGQKDLRKSMEITDKIVKIKFKNESFAKGGQTESLVRDSKKGNTPARDLNNYNDVLDVEADGQVGAETGLFANGGGVGYETILFAVKKGEPDYAEVLITNNPDKIEDAKKWALANGFDRLRVSKIDMNRKPDFKKTFADGGAVGSDFTFLKSNPMQRARAIIVLEKKIRHDGKIIPNYEFLEELPKNLEVGVSKLYSNKSEKGYVEKTVIGDFIIDSKAEVDYYNYLKNGGYPYSKYIAEVREAEAKKREADKIVSDEQQRLREISDIERYKNSQIAKNNQIKELIENGADAMIKKMNAPRLMQIEKYKNQRQTNDVKQDIEYHTRMIEQTERQVNNAYKIASELYKIVNGEVQPKFDWKIGDKVKVEGYVNNLPAEIETEIVELKENKFGEIAYRVESKDGIANTWIRYDGIYPMIQKESIADKNEYEYVLTQRPFDIGTYPLNNFIRFEEKDFQYGVVIYSEPLSIDEMERYSLSPITEIKDYDGKILDYKIGNLKLKARVKLETDKRKGYYVNLFISDNNGIKKTQPMSGVNFLMEIKNGRLILENESTVEPMNEKVNKKEKSFESEGSTEGKGKLYEFFTPQIVADKMLALAQHYGFKGGNVLEPATGSGRLIKNLKNTNITAFEISKDNFEILKREFPNAELYNFNFEKAFLKEPRFNTLINRKGTETWLKNAPFDLVMANPPYGKFSGLYSSYFNFKGQVEHFFILQTLYLLKKGGLGVYLIPSSFLRNGVAYNEIKKQIFEIAEFVDAYRLPSNIFEKTQIGTDILILRKK